MIVHIRVPVFPTESGDKVILALENVFGPLDVREEDGWIVAEADNLEAFSDLLRKQKIRDTARAFLLGRIEGNCLRFSLNKQAAYVGRVNFVSDEQPLGAIDVTVEGTDPEALVLLITRID